MRLAADSFASVPAVYVRNSRMSFSSRPLLKSSVLGSLSNAATPAARLLLDQGVVVGQGEHGARGRVEDRQRDPLALEVVDQLRVDLEDLAVVGRHRAGHVEAQDDVPGPQPVHDHLGLDGARGHRADADQRDEQAHEPPTCSAR